MNPFIDQDPQYYYNDYRLPWYEQKPNKRGISLPEFSQPGRKGQRLLQPDQILSSSSSELSENDETGIQPGISEFVPERTHETGQEYNEGNDSDKGGESEEKGDISDGNSEVEEGENSGSEERYDHDGHFSRTDSETDQTNSDGSTENWDTDSISDYATDPEYGEWYPDRRDFIFD